MKIKLLLLLLLTSWSSAYADTKPFVSPIGDDRVVSGSLKNGLTYYIFPSKNSGNQADFFLARSVGSVNEEENERGLAHFLEHLCFNGSKHFPGNDVISYLESVGVKFGKNLNAYTSADRTIYNISKVPTKSSETLDSCLLILRDWSGNLSLQDKDIESERGVIHEEWRQRSSPTNRMLEKAMPRLFPGSRYGNRMPIGLLEIVDNFQPQQLRDFYKKWHRPDNEAIIVVGDVDPEYMEQKIKELFSSLKENKKTDSFNAVVPDNDRLITVVETDREQPMESISLFLKYPRPKTAELREDMRREILSSLLQNMLVNRYDDLELSDTTVCSKIGIGDQTYLLASPVRALMIRANIAPGKSETGVAQLYSVLLSARHFGFSEEELSEATQSVVNSLSRSCNNESLRSNTDIANRLVRTFLNGERFDTPEARLQMALEIIPQISTRDVQDYLISITDPNGKNMVVLCYAPDNGDNSSSPEEALLEKAFYSVNIKALLPYSPTKITRQLLPEEPTRGKILSSKNCNSFGMEKLSLSNGIEVYIKPTDFHKDEICLRGIGTGGFSQRYTPEYAASMKLLEDILPVCGFGDLSSSELRRFMHGRNMKVSSAISNTEETLELISNSEDLENAFRLLYLRATDIRPDLPAINAFLESKRHSLSRIFNNPVQVMGDSITSIIYSGQPLGRKVKLETLENFNLDSALNIYRDRFADCSDFKFYITGDFSRQQLFDLVERYIASLPTSGRIEQPKNIGYRFPKDNKFIPFTTPMQTPLGVVYQFRHLECPYTLANILTASAVGSILKSKLLADLREDKGWTYSITGHGAVVCGINGDDPSEFMMPVHIKSSPEHVSEINATIIKTIEDMAKGEISDNEILKVKNYYLKNIVENREDNTYWLVVMRALHKYGADLDSDYIRTVESLSPNSIATFIREYVLPAHITTIQMTPSPQ